MTSLDDKKVTKAIFQGLKTSADWAYNFYKVGGDSFYSLDEDGNKKEITIEAAIMRPLVSGDSADRYCNPEPEKSILFPYKIEGESAILYSESELKSLFPKTWTYLKSIEEKLRNREDKSFDDDQWYRFGRSQNISKQDKAKLGVSTTVQNMEVFSDYNGEFCFSGARVEGVLPTEEKDALFLLGILNSKPVNFVFRRIGRPKSGGFFEANKQFIAPLPVPKATADQKSDVGNRAKALQELHTKRRDKLKLLEKRFETCPVKKRNDDWLFPQIGKMDHWKAKAPADFSARDKTKWAKEQRQLKIDERIEGIYARLNPAAQLAARFTDGELLFTVDGIPIIDKVFVSDIDGQHILTYWQHLARTTSITEKFKAQTLVNKLCATPMTENADLSAWSTPDLESRI